jgi:D-alanyl-D-alanine carboxypeptidase
MPQSPLRSVPPAPLPRRRFRRCRDRILLGTFLAAAALLSGCADSPSGSTHPGAGSDSASGLPGDLWAAHITEASQRFDVPETWIRAVMQVESGGRTTLNGRPIISRAGAMGLMQVMPITYDEMRVRYGLGPDPYEPRDNVLAGTAYLREMYDRFGTPGFLAAYNAGPGRYGEYLTGDRGLPAETLNYVAVLAPQVYPVHPNRRAPDSMIAATLPPAPSRRTVLASAPVPVPMPVPAPRITATELAPPVPALSMARPVSPPRVQLADAGDWGIQVGAFRSAAESSRAVEQARRVAPDLLTPARPFVIEVNTPSGRLYRARLLGVTSANADRACVRLTSRGAACMTVAPDMS